MASPFLFYGEASSSDGRLPADEDVDGTVETIPFELSTLIILLSKQL